MMERPPAKTLVSHYRADNKWFGCHYTMNIYKGYGHSCICCDSPSERYGIRDFSRVPMRFAYLLRLSTYRDTFFFLCPHYRLHDRVPKEGLPPSPSILKTDSEKMLLESS